MAGSSDPMTLGIDGGGTTLICVRGCPQIGMPSSWPTSWRATSSTLCPSLGQIGPLRDRVVERPRPAEQRHLGFQVVDLIERAEDREDEIGVVFSVRNRRGEGVPQSGEEFLVGSLCHTVRLKQPTSILASAPNQSAVG